MSEKSEPTLFLAMHDETLTLLIESRNYIQSLRENGNRNAAQSVDYLDVTLETMRLTTRLTQVMAWLLAQRAVQNNELPRTGEEAREYRLSGQSVCMDWRSSETAHLPSRLRDLLRRSFDLYRRVGRLEAQIDRRLENGAYNETGRPEERPENLPYLQAVTTSDQIPRNVC
jgi:regulator of CtrA degradation